MKKTMIFAVMFLMLFAVAQAATYQNFSWSAIGGFEHGKLNLATDLLYSGEFKGFFVQGAGFANILGEEKEYGASFGIGGTTSNGSDLYLFAETLYKYGKFWFQLRPTVRFRLSWMSLSGFYALPVLNPTIQVDGQEVCAAQYWGGELNIVPVPWGRIYGNIFSVNKAFNFQLGAEVRPIKWVSVTAEWNKAGADIYSQWTSGNFRIAVSLLLGAQQQSFSPIQRIQVVPMYPILARKVNSVESVKWEYRYNVPVTYNRDVSKISNPKGPDSVYFSGELYDYPQGKLQIIQIKMTKIGENQFSCIIPKIWVNSSDIHHVVRVNDCKVAIPGGNPVTNRSAYTGENIDIPGSYNRKIKPVASTQPFPNGSELWFMIN